MSNPSPKRSAKFKRYPQFVFNPWGVYNALDPDDYEDYEGKAPRGGRRIYKGDDSIQRYMRHQTALNHRMAEMLILRSPVVIPDPEPEDECR